MKRIIFTFCVLFTLVIYVNAGELYTCIDLDGNSIVTDNPQDGMKNCVLKDSYIKPSSEESANEKGKVIIKKDNIIVKTKEPTEESEKRINNCISCCNNKIKTCHNYFELLTFDSGFFFFFSTEKPNLPIYFPVS